MHMRSASLLEYLQQQAGIPPSLELVCTKSNLLSRRHFGILFVSSIKARFVV